MRTKKEKKSRKQSGTKPRGRNAVKTVSAAPPQTIKEVMIESITANSLITNDEMIALVKERFPKAAFDARHATWYRSQARKGLLTGTPIPIPPQTKKSAAKSK